MKLVSFNANGIRSRMHQLQALKERLDPDIIGVQEIKVQDAGFPLAEVEALGYHVEHFGQKSHYGVALLSKTKPLSVTKGFPFETEDDQRRLITAVYEPVPGQRLTVINGYFPQGESRDHPVKFPNKTRFYAGLKRYLSESFDSKESLVVMGDMNVAPQDKDIGIGPDNAKRWLKTGKCSFLPEEREWVNALMDWGLADTYRCKYPDEDSRFSWFDYRSRGFEREPRRGLRIDLLLATAPLIERCVDAGIDYEIRSMDKPSDHCPVWAAFEL